MQAVCTTDRMFAAQGEFSVVMADTTELQIEVFEMRNQVYCLERGYESSTTGLETDTFDATSRHVLLRHRRTNVAVGTVRIVLPIPERPETSFPMQLVCPARVLQGLPLETTGEVSRFSLSKERLSKLEATDWMPRLALFHGIMRASHEAGVTHWCALMERSLLRLLRVTGIHFEPLGVMVEHHGMRQPSFGRVSDIMARMHDDARPAWDYITDNGALLPAPPSQVQQA